MVYVLLKKGSATNDIKVSHYAWIVESLRINCQEAYVKNNFDSSQVRGPAPTRPSKPEVYFIRYKDQASSGGNQGGYSGGGAFPAIRAPSQAYGAP